MMVRCGFSRSSPPSALVAALTASPTTARAVTGPFRSDGHWLKDAQGRTVIVHGLQLAHKRRPYHPSPAQFGARDARLIAGLGFNVVRVAWMWKGLEPRRDHLNRAYRREIVREVRDLSKAGVLTLLEAHQDVYNEKLSGVGFPDWATLTGGARRGPKRTRIQYGYPAVHIAFSNLYHDKKGIAREFASAWRRVAAAVKPYRSHLLGYDLINEPWTGGAGPGAGCSKLCARFDRRLLGPFQTRLARAVRTVDRKTVVFYEPHQLFDFGAHTALRRAPRSVRPAAFAFHAYCAPKRGRILHVNDESHSPGYRSCLRDLSDVFGTAQSTARRLHAPPLLDEFGDTGDAGLVERQLDRADRDRTGWVYWSYKDFADVPGGRGDGSLFRDDDHFTSLMPSRESLLARAYPEATAGEPVAWHWDRATATFELEVRPDERITAPTVISLPVRTHYPNGYVVSAIGGDVVSPPGASRLEVRTDPGARQLRVEVTPAG